MSGNPALCFSDSQRETNNLKLLFQNYFKQLLLSSTLFYVSNVFFQLGLPLSCLCTVPSNTLPGSTHKMDIPTLEKLLEDDISAGKTPVLVVAYAGTPLVGHVDNIQALQAICKKSEIWLHIEGFV